MKDTTTHLLNEIKNKISTCETVGPEEFKAIIDYLVAITDTSQKGYEELINTINELKLENEDIRKDIDDLFKRY